MALQETPRGRLEWLLNYELRSAARYRRFSTLILVASAQGDADLEHLLEDNVRSCDELFPLESNAAILMAETDRAGAMVAVDRYKSMCSQEVDLRFAMASYPADSGDPDDLLDTAERRLTEAKKRQFGAVVTQGFEGSSSKPVGQI